MGASYRCSPCDVNLPPWREFETCPGCGRDTWRINEDYPRYWKEDLEKLQATSAPKSASELAGLYPHPPDARVDVREQEGREWIVHQDLIDAGYEYLESFSIVFVNKTFYELQGHTGASFRLLGQHYPTGVWWVEEVPLKLRRSSEATSAS